MHGVGAEQAVDLGGPDDLRRDAGGNVLLGQPPRRVLGQQQLADPPLRIGERERHGMPAIEDRRAVGAVSRSRKAGLVAAAAFLAEGLAGTGAEWPLLVVVAHGRLVSRVPDSGNFDPEEQEISGTVSVDFAPSLRP